MDGSNARIANGWMELFAHRRTGANPIDEHHHGKRVDLGAAHPGPTGEALAALEKSKQSLPLTQAEAEAREEFKRLLNKRPARTDAERRLEQLIERAANRTR